MKARTAVLCLLGLLNACASRQQDHFYILTALPPSTGPRLPAPSARVSLRVSVPSLVDRSEMVLNTGTDGVMVMDHERWAAPLTDLMAQALAEDMEHRRPDVLVAGPSGSHSDAPAFKVMIDIVRMTARKGGEVSIASHWRIVDAASGHDTAGGEELSAPLANDGYGAVAQALSECLALLADRVVRQIPHPD